MSKEQERVEGIDPNLVPSSLEQRQTAHIKHPDGKLGILKYDRLSLTIEPITNDKPLQRFAGKWTGDPDRTELIEEKFLNRDQPFIGTCSKPIPGQNMGCFSHNGCPYPDPTDTRGRGPGPFMLIIEKDGQRSQCPCYHFYHGVRRGMPTAQAHYAYSGWKCDTTSTSTTSTKSRVVTDEWGNRVYSDEEIEIQVQNLGPMYAEHFGKRRQKPKPEKPVFGREEMPDMTKTVNPKPGGIVDAPRPDAVQSVKIQG